MFNTVLGKYFPVSSRIHKMNSTSKIICVLLFLIALSISSHFLFIIFLVLLTLAMMYLSNVPWKLYLQNVLGLSPLIIFLIVIDLIFGVSIVKALVIALKVILGVLYTLILTYTTSSTEITYGLEQLFGPLKIIKIPVNKMALSISLALRFIPTIFEQVEKILKSQSSRGIDFTHSNLSGKITALTSMLLPMFMLSFKRADNLADAMEVRLYNYNSKRTNYRLNKWGAVDDMMILLHIVIIAIFIIRGFIK